MERYRATFDLDFNNVIIEKLDDVLKVVQTFEYTVTMSKNGYEIESKSDFILPSNVYKHFRDKLEAYWEIRYCNVSWVMVA